MLINVDQKISSLINLIIPHNVFFNAFFSFFSLQGMAIMIWALIAVLVIIFEEKKYPGISNKDLQFIIFLSTTLLFTFVLVNYISKPIFRRSRPQQISNCPKDYSFPSSHAATAFAAASVTAFFYKKRSWFFYAVAILISLSRIYLGCHYFFDVLTGAVFGYLVSFILLRSDRETSPLSKKN